MIEYSTPKIEIIIIENTDIIATSDHELPGSNSGTETPDDNLWD